jgi:TRAP transporter TAXI family solute receptor
MVYRIAPLERPARWFYVLAAILILLAIAATIVWLGPLPPRVVVMTTGSPGSDYDALGRRYQEILKRSGVKLRLMPSAGGVENLQRLNDPHSGVTVGFAQGGLTDEAHSPALASLGTMFFQPVWFFTRIAAGPKLEALLHKRVSIGPEGGGTRVLARKLIELNGIDPSSLQLLALSPRETATALLQGDIDAAVIVTSWESEAVRQLLASSDVTLLGFPRADAYVALYPYLTKLILPTGVGNLATNRPPNDVPMIAPKASLIVRSDLHPAIQYLLLEAAAEIHSQPSIFQQSGKFPAAERDDLPLSDDATQFYKSGRPFLQRYMPFWLATLASRFLVLLIPLAGIAYPLLRVVPAAYGWSMRRRIFTLYGELKFIEADIERRGGATPEVLARLERLDERANSLHVPITFAHFLYQLRAHITLVRSRVSTAGAAARVAPGS